MASVPELAPRLEPPRRGGALADLSISTRTFTAGLLGLAAGMGILIAYSLKIGLGLLAALCFAPLAFLNLPLAIALWLPCSFLDAIGGVSLAVKGGGIVIALAWLGVLRKRGVVVPAAIRRRGLALLLLLVWMACSVAWATVHGTAATQLSYWIAAALLFAVLVTLDLSPRQMKMIVIAYVVGVVLSTILGFLGGFASQLSTLTEQQGRLQGGAGDPNYLAAGIVPALALLIGLGVSVRTFLWKFVMTVSAVILVLGLGATESRGGLLAALMAIVLALVVARGGRIYVLALITVVLGLGAAWFAAQPQALHRVTNTAEEGNGRGSFWTIALRMTRDHPIEGVGLANFQVKATDYTRRPGKLVYVDIIVDKPHVVHNIYLQQLSETGIVGLALLLLVLTGSLRASLLAARRFDRLGDTEFSALARASLVALAAGMTASIFLSNATDFQFWLLISLGPAMLALAHRRAAASDRAVLAPGV